jgi:hypothetical protein
MRALLPVTVPALVLLVAVPAHAVVTYSFFDASFSATGDGAADSITISCAAGEVLPAPPMPTPCASVERISVNPGEGTDDVDLSAVTAVEFPVLTEVSISDDDVFADDLTGSALDDRIISEGADVIDAGPGDDVVEGGIQVDGGEGDDVLFEAASGGSSDGGPGDDRFVQTLSQDGNDGGTGYDVMELDFDRSGFPIEDVTILVTGAQLLVSAPLGDQDVFVTRFEELHVTMPRGDGQTLDASDFPGKIVYRGSRQGDTFVGSELEDVVATGKGDDAVMARDGGFDLVDCGAGTDNAVVDPQDRVVGCESVSYPRPQTSAVSGPRRIEKGARASYTFGSSIAGSVFQCRVDAGRWRACSSPTTVVAGKKLRAGRHVLSVRAGFPAGNWDTTPSRKRFRVKGA